MNASKEHVAIAIEVPSEISIAVVSCGEIPDSYVVMDTSIPNSEIAFDTENSTPSHASMGKGWVWFDEKGLIGVSDDSTHSLFASVWVRPVASNMNERK